MRQRWRSASSRPIPSTVAEGLEQNQEARREVLSLALSSDQPVGAVIAILRMGSDLASPEDVEWLAQRAVESENEDVHSAVGIMLRDIAEWGNAPEQVFAVHAVTLGVQRQLGILFDAVAMTERPSIRSPDQQPSRQLSDLAALLRQALQASIDDPVAAWTSVLREGWVDPRRERPALRDSPCQERAEWRSSSVVT
jgi:hypothetical protein